MDQNIVQFGSCNFISSSSSAEETIQEGNGGTEGERSIVAALEREMAQTSPAAYCAHHCSNPLRSSGGYFQVIPLE